MTQMFRAEPQEVSDSDIRMLPPWLEDRGKDGPARLCRVTAVLLLVAGLVPGDSQTQQNLHCLPEHSVIQPPTTTRLPQDAHNPFVQGLFAHHAPNSNTKKMLRRLGNGFQSAWFSDILNQNEPSISFNNFSSLLWEDDVIHLHIFCMRHLWQDGTPRSISRLSVMCLRSRGRVHMMTTPVIVCVYMPVHVLGNTSTFCRLHRQAYLWAHTKGKWKHSSEIFHWEMGNGQTHCHLAGVFILF